MEKYCKRDCLDEIKNILVRNQAIIIVGSRQVGKTTVLQMLRNHYAQLGEETVFLDLEIPSNLKIFEKGIEGLLFYLKTYYQKSSNEKIVYLFLDEFHYIPNAGKLIKILVDNYKNVKIIASGSSSIEIQKTLSESSVGRKQIIKLYPLSFGEYLIFKEAKEYESYKEIALESSVPTFLKDVFKEYFNQYLIWGGMPRCVLEENNDMKLKQLEEIVSSYLQKDIKALLGSDKMICFNKALELIAHETCSIMNINSLSSELQLDRKEVKKILFVMQNTFTNDTIPPFFRNKRKELSKARKSIFYDTGVRNSILSNFSHFGRREDKGKIFETVVYNEIKKNILPGQRMFYWRTIHQTEVDFVIGENDIFFPIEVKVKKTGLPKAVMSFSKNYKSPAAFIVNAEKWETIKVNGINVFFLPPYCSHLIPRVVREFMRNA